ncbi:MAG: IclR family transcriptional regulator [Geminicoccales bacterium]
MLDDDLGRPETSLRSLRLLLILEEVAKVGVPATPTEVNKSIGLPKQTLHRMFASLEAQGFLQREHDGRSYSPGLRMRSMAINTISSPGSRAARLAVMSRLAKDIGETCNLSIPDRDAMIYADRIETEWPLRIQLPIGTRVPLHCTASGKLYLSTLPKNQLARILDNTDLEQRTSKTLATKEALSNEIERIRAEGFSEDNEEFMEGMIALAVPIKGRGGRFLSALAFHAPTPRMPFSAAHQHLDRLHEAAAELAHILIEDSGDA